MVKQGFIREIAIECVVNGQYAIITVYHYGTEDEFLVFKEELELVKLDKTNIKNLN